LEQAFCINFPGKRNAGSGYLHFIRRERQREGECVRQRLHILTHAHAHRVASNVDADTCPPQTRCAPKGGGRERAREMVEREGGREKERE